MYVIMQRMNRSLPNLKTAHQKNTIDHNNNNDV